MSEKKSKQLPSEMLENLVKLTAKKESIFPLCGLNTVFLISLSQVLLSLQLVVLSQIKWDLHIQIFVCRW
jgi:hypothetical protein